jgi:transcription elongation GreA/GreB family factor
MHKDLVILDEDKAYARARITELEKAIQDLGPEFYEVFNQSSETWHDNAPFDALRDRQSVLDAELQQLRTVLRNSLPSVPRQKKDVVGIGTTVVIEDSLGVRQRYRIAGDWTPFAGMSRNGSMVVSCNAPIAKLLLGNSIGATIQSGNRQSIIKEISHANDNERGTATITG